MKFIDLTGKKINKLTVLNRDFSAKTRVAWKCLCDCGKETTVFSNNILTGHTKSCGCEKRHEDIRGQMFGNFLVEENAGVYKRQIKWSCICKICNNKKIFLSSQLRSQFHSGINLKCNFCYEMKENNKRLSKMLGKSFGKLTVISYERYSFISQNRKTHFWKCLCDCGKEVNISERSLLSGNNKSCLSCSTKKGSEHHSWNPNLNEEDRIKRRDHKSVIWRKQIYNRDNYTCQISKERGCYLNAHHLYSWHANKELRYDIANGISIKEEIHNLFHSIYGKRFNTPEQFFDFKRRYDLGEFC